MPFTHNFSLPGIDTTGTEFLARDENTLRVWHNRQEVAFESLPEYVYKTIKNVMGRVDATICEMKAFAIEQWGGMDRMIDISEDGIPSGREYIPGYTKAYYDCGKEISEAQLRILKHIHLDDKTIADTLFISKYTVARHCQDIYNNLGIDDNQGSNKRAMAALWVKDRGIN